MMALQGDLERPAPIAVFKSCEAETLRGGHRPRQGNLGLGERVLRPGNETKRLDFPTECGADPGVN